MPTSGSAMTFIGDLAGLPIRVPWQLEPAKNPTKPPRKVPWRARGWSGPGSSTDPACWGYRAEAEARAAALPKPLGGGGIGLIIGAEADDGLLIGGVDLDTCRAADDDIAAWALDVVDRVDFDAEISPSSTPG